MKKISTFDIGILGKMDATEVAQKIQAKEISSQEAVACAIERARKSADDINAIVNHDYLKAVENSRQNHHGIFAGVPMFIKD